MPRSLFLFSSLLGVLLPTFWPNLHPVPFHEPLPALVNEWSQFWGWQGWFLGSHQSLGIGISAQGAITSIVGLLVGLLLGLSLTVMIRSPEKVDHAPWKGLMIIGAFLGWQAVFSISFLTLGCVLVIRCGMSRIAIWWRRLPLTAYLTIAALFHILLWKRLTGIPWWPSSHSSLLEWGSIGGVLIGLLCLIRWTVPFTKTESPGECPSPPTEVSAQ